VHDAPTTDGRRARGERTRQRVLESLIDLIENGDLRPSAQRVAAHAGVALRTVSHHFEDIEALRATANRLQFERHLQLLPDVDPHTPLEERIAVVTRQRQKLFEAITPMRRAALLDSSSTQVADGLRESRDMLRRRIADAFENEISLAGAGGLALLDALDVVTSWQTWHFLRSQLSRKPSEAARVVERLVRRLLVEGGD
jgi:TetR/AcrR family transcriptional regulator, regulator of autoinduction and epiphytic fitness